MRGYLSFMLAFVCTMLLLSLLQLPVSSYDFSKAVAVERASGLHQNFKETAEELLRQGAVAGFNAYDSVHETSSCIHCGDYFCSPPAEPPPPNICDAELCSHCFRESDARAEAKGLALLNFQQINNHSFADDFSFNPDFPDVSVFTKISPLSKNGFSLAYVRFDNGLDIALHSDKFNLSASGKIPRGAIIESPGID